jgi:mRNA interferase RelE/StbE
VNYALRILRRAQKQMQDLPKAHADRVRETIAALAGDPRPSGAKKLVGRDGWRLRQGDYRIVYSIDDRARVVLILDIGHRRDIYR